MSPGEKWTRFKDYLREKEKQLISDMKQVSITEEDHRLLRLAPQLALMSQLITKAEQLDHPPTMDKRFAPPND